MSTDIESEPTCSPESKRRRADPEAASSEDNDGFVLATHRRTPPVFVYGVEYFGLSDMLYELGLKFGAKSVGKGVRVQFASIEDFRAGTKALTDREVEYHSFLLKEEKDLKLVIRGIPLKTAPEQVKQRLERVGIYPKHVAQLKPGGRLIPLFLVYLAGGSDATKLRELKAISGISIHVEIFRGRGGPAQCFRCQRWGHSSAACKSRRRCVRCGEEHDAKSCPLPLTEPAVCCNCRASHPASFRGCRVAVALKKRDAATKATAKQNARSAKGKAAKASKAAEPVCSLSSSETEGKSEAKRAKGHSKTARSKNAPKDSELKKTGAAKARKADNKSVPVSALKGTSKSEAEKPKKVKAAKTKKVLDDTFVMEVDSEPSEARTAKARKADNKPVLELKTPTSDVKTAKKLAVKKTKVAAAKAIKADNQPAGGKTPNSDVPANEVKLTKQVTAAKVTADNKTAKRKHNPQSPSADIEKSVGKKKKVATTSTAKAQKADNKSVEETATSAANATMADNQTARETPGKKSPTTEVTGANPVSANGSTKPEAAKANLAENKSADTSANADGTEATSLLSVLFPSGVDPNELRRWASKFLPLLREAKENSYERMLVLSEAIVACPGYPDSGF